MNKISKLFIFITLLALVFSLNITVKAATKSKTVKTQKEFLSAIKDSKIQEIVINPTKKTTFTIPEDYNADKSIKVYVKYATIKGDMFYYNTKYVATTQTELINALKTDSCSNIYFESNKKQTIKISDGDYSSLSLYINAPNSDISISDNVGTIHVLNMENGILTDNYGRRNGEDILFSNSILVQGKIKKIVIGKNCIKGSINFLEATTKKTTVDILGNLSLLEANANVSINLTGKIGKTTKSFLYNNFVGKGTLSVNGKKISSGNSGLVSLDGKIISLEDFEKLNGGQQDAFGSLKYNLYDKNGKLIAEETKLFNKKTIDKLVTAGYTYKETGCAFYSSYGDAEDSNSASIVIDMYPDEYAKIEFRNWSETNKDMVEKALKVYLGNEASKVVEDITSFYNGDVRTINKPYEVGEYLIQLVSPPYENTTYVIIYE